MMSFLRRLLCFGLASAPMLACGSELDAIEVKTLSGGSMKLGDFAGKAVLLVNVASQGGYTNQYAGLAELYKAPRDKGLVVIGWPCNDFGGQEPGSAAEIQQFCQTQYQVSFPMTAKIGLSSGTHPLFVPLLKDGAVQWNFEKFLLGRDHRLVRRFGSDAEPRGGDLEAAVLKALEAPSTAAKPVKP